MTGSDLTSPAPLAFVGLGSLGLPMAINLHRAGYPLRLTSRRRNKLPGAGALRQR